MYHWNFKSFLERVLISIFIGHFFENLMLFQNHFGLIVLSASERTQKRHQSSLNFVAFLANCCKSILLNVCTKVKQSFINDCKQVHWYLLHCIATLICRNYCRFPVFTFEMAISMLGSVQNVGSKISDAEKRKNLGLPEIKEKEGRIWSPGPPGPPGLPGSSINENDYFGFLDVCKISLNIFKHDNM